jgi:predicted nucleotidyltransferase
MGMLFPWRFIRQGLVPTLLDFERVAQDILNDAQQARAFKAAAFVGSLVRGDLNSRSDLDLILVARDRRIGQARELQQLFQRHATSHGIPLDSRLWSSRDARLGRHTYGPSYLQTFPMGPTRFSIGRPLAVCFTVPDSSVQMEMVHKLDYKLHSTQTRAGIFLARYRENSATVEEWLESNWTRVVRPMRSYITLGRRLLWWRHGTLPNDGKVEVITKFLAEPAFASMHADYQLLVDLDSLYDELLTRALDGRVRRKNYLLQVAVLLQGNFRVSLQLLKKAVSLTKGSETETVDAV